MDIININSKFKDGRYTDAMGQMADYLLCLKRTNQIDRMSLNPPARGGKK